MLTIFKTSFFLKFHTLAVKIGQVKIGQSKNKTGNMKIITDPLRDCYVCIGFSFVETFVFVIVRFSYRLTTLAATQDPFQSKIWTVPKRTHRVIYFAKINEYTIPPFNNIKLRTLLFLHNQNLSETMHDLNIDSDSMNMRSLFAETS